MRYKSPARSSFRDNKTYETLTTRSTYSTVDRGVDGPNGPNYSDDSVIDFPNKDKSPKEKKAENKHHKGVSRSPQGLTQLAEYSYDQKSAEKYKYNIIGQTQGVTVI